MAFVVVSGIAELMGEAAAATGGLVATVGTADLLALVVGATVTLPALRSGASALRLRLFGRRALGIVIGATRQDDAETYAARIRFADHSGETHVIEALLGTGSNPLGRQVLVLYSPRNPAHAEWKANARRALTRSAAVVIAGIACAAIGAEGIAAGAAFRPF